MKDNALKTETIEWLKRETPHFDCEDCWYSCATLCCDDRRKSEECDCGADDENKAKADILRALGLTS
jgi:hypothetical protein